MIYNNDFVTNSSSTSFVLIQKEGSTFSLKDFLSASGVSEDSPLAIIYKRLYELIKDGIITQVFSFEEANNDYRAFNEFSAEGEKEIRRRIGNGEKAFVGSIHDDDAVGCYFLGKKVVIIGDTFYFNWEPDAY